MNTMYIKRAIENVIIAANAEFPVVLVTGPRQVGKTTMLEHLAGTTRQYISLDDPLARDTAKSDPALFLQRYSPPVLIDEIQYAPELLPHIKIYVDTHKQAGDFWLTGSQMFHMMKNVSESLAGRVAVVPMQGLSNTELLGEESTPFVTVPDILMQKKEYKRQNLVEVYERIYNGSMPSVALGDRSFERFYSSYVDTYLQRDIKDLTQVADEMSFLRFMTAAAARTSGMLNYTELAKEVGITAPTAKQWMSILISSGVVMLLEPYHNNALKRMVKAPNLYFMDTGLAAYLTRWDSAKTLEISAMSGAFFETYVVSEVVKSYLNAGKRPPVFYYRDNDGREIDLILYYNDTLYPVEIKKAANPGKDAIKHFDVLDATKKQIGNGAVVCMASDVMPIDENSWRVPLWMV